MFYMMVCIMDKLLKRKTSLSFQRDADTSCGCKISTKSFEKIYLVFNMFK